MTTIDQTYRIKFDISQAMPAIKMVEKELDKVGKKALLVGKAIDKAINKDSVKSFRKLGAETNKAGKKFDNLNNKVKKVGRTLDMVSKKAAKVGRSMASAGRQLTFGLTLPTVLLGGAAIKSAADYEEAIDKVSVVFGDAKKTVTDFTDHALNQFGLGKLSAIEMTSLFGDMATGMKIPKDEAANLSIEMAKLAADTASLKNVPLDEIKTAFAGIFTGETESMKRIGVMLQQKNIQDWMKGEGIKGQIKEMRASEQAILRFKFVQDTLSAAVGNFEQTQESAANQMRTLSESAQDLKIEIGTNLIPVFVMVLKKIRKVVSWSSNLKEETKESIIIWAGLAAALGPVLFIIGKVVIALAMIKTAMLAIIPFVASNPIVLAIVAVVAALTLLFFKFETVTAYVEEVITQWIMWFQELKVAIIEGVVDALNFVIEKINSVLKFLGKEPIEVTFDANLATQDIKNDIKRLQAQKSSIDFDAATKADADRMKSIFGDILGRFDLPESDRVVSSTEPEKKKKKRGKRRERGSNFSEFMRPGLGASKKERRASIAARESARLRFGAEIDRKIASMGAQKTTVTNNMTVKMDISGSQNPRDVARQVRREIGNIGTDMTRAAQATAAGEQ